MKKLFIPIIGAICLATTSVSAQVLLDTSNYFADNVNNSSTSHTFSGFSVADNSNRVLAVQFAASTLNDFDPSNVSASFDGNSMTLANSADNTGSGIFTFYMLDANIGAGAQSGDLVVNYGGSLKAGDDVAIGVASLYNVQQSAPATSFSAGLSGATQTWSESITVSSGAFVLGGSVISGGGMAFDSPNPVDSESASPAWDRVVGGGASVFYEENLSAGTFTATYSDNNTDEEYSIGLTEFAVVPEPSTAALLLAGLGAAALMGRRRETTRA